MLHVHNKCQKPNGSVQLSTSKGKLILQQSLFCLFVCLFFSFFFLWRCNPTRVMASFLRFLDHTRRTTVGRTPLDERSARRRDLYLTTHDTHNRQTSMPPAGFEPTISFFFLLHSVITLLQQKLHILLSSIGMQNFRTLKQMDLM